LSAAIAVNRKQEWEAFIDRREQMIEELRTYLAGSTDLGITALRKPEAKIASHLKQLDWQIAAYRSDGVSKHKISLAEQQKTTLAQLRDQVAELISAKEAQRRPRRSPVSASTLTTDLGAKVDELVRVFMETPVMSPEEQSRLSHSFTRKAAAKMLDEGLTYGRASGAPEFLNQDEAAFRAFMKTVDQDLAWQCETVAAAFDRYQLSGEVPAPHFPMRVTVLLRKAKDFDRERDFLAAWCRHFPRGAGVKYAALVDRAMKVGALGPSGR
jgi:hypothetical protein